MKVYDYINRVDKRFRLAICKGMKIHSPLSLLRITMILRERRNFFELACYVPQQWHHEPGLCVDDMHE